MFIAVSLFSTIVIMAYSHGKGDETRLYWLSNCIDQYDKEENASWKRQLLFQLCPFKHQGYFMCKRQQYTSIDSIDMRCFNDIEDWREVQQ